LKSIVKVVDQRLQPNFQPKRTTKNKFLVTSTIMVREQETLCLPGTETLWNNQDFVEQTGWRTDPCIL